MTNERLDEAIDRVARAMTTVPADPAFTARLTDRLSRATSYLPRWVLAAPAAAVVLLVTFLLSRPDSGRPASIAGAGQPGNVPAVTSPRPIASAASDTSSTTARPLSSAGIQRIGTTRRTSATRPLEPADAEDAIPPLNVAALTLEPLTLADVEVSLLDVASLEIADIERGVEPKEPK